MYLFSYIWILCSLSYILEESFVLIAVVLELLYFYIHKGDKFT